MQPSSNFLKLSAVAGVITAVSLFGLASQIPAAAAVAQATAIPTTPVAVTTAATAAPATPAPAATEGAYPPCPAAVTPVPASTTSATQAAAPAATAAATTAAVVAATNAAPSATQSATAAATSDTSNASTPAAPSAAPAATAVATASPMVVGAFQTASGCNLTALLAGPNELPKPGNANASGLAILTISRPQTGLGQICVQITTTNLTLPATMAHIHAGPAGIAGPVVVPLAVPDASGKASGCTSGVDPSLIKAILLYPQDYYVNVHTSDFPGGAARGQLAPSGQ